MSQYDHEPGTRTQAAAIPLDGPDDRAGLPGTVWIRGFLEHVWTQHLITIVIVVNAITIGCETSTYLMERAGPALELIDRLALVFFSLELTLKLYAYRLAFFRSGWNLFDALVVGVSLAPVGDGTSVLRALRVIRTLRLISAVPSMRVVTEALVRAVPGMGAVVALLALVFYVAGVMATKLFGAAFPDWFGTLGRSAFTLFQIMTLESWSMGIVRPVMAAFPWAWTFFVGFILIVTFAVLNLFIAIIVNATHDAAHPPDEMPQGDAADLRQDLQALRQEIRALRAEVATNREKDSGGTD